MQTITEIYKHYKIMPLLETHQLRVAAVAALICDSIDAEIDRNEIISACLLHDMGNIIKFDLSNPLTSLSEEEVDYWLSVQKEFRVKYPNEHVASYEIAKEIGVNRLTLELISNIGISKSHIVAADSDNLNQKIGSYSDMRVGPFGALSLEDRIAEAKKRYSKKFYGIENDKQVEIWLKALLKIEKDIFSQTTIAPSQINNDSIEPYISKVRKFSIV